MLDYKSSEMKLLYKTVFYEKKIPVNIFPHYIMCHTCVGLEQI